MDNKDIFSSNLKMYMELSGKSRNDISNALGISYFTITDWVKGKKYPRMDKVEMLANYFGIPKSYLIEEKNKPSPEEIKLNEGEQLLLDLFRKIPEDQQGLVLNLIRAALGNPEQ
jgi:transcriptional regulator with XRE-family HTH domain